MNKDLLERIKKTTDPHFRGNDGRTLSALAESIGVDPLTLSRWRKGKSTPSWDNLNALDRAVGGGIITPPA